MRVPLKGETLIDEFQINEMEFYSYRAMDRHGSGCATWMVNKKSTDKKGFYKSVCLAFGDALPFIDGYALKNGFYRGWNTGRYLRSNNAEGTINGIHFFRIKTSNWIHQVDGISVSYEEFYRKVGDALGKKVIIMTDDFFNAESQIKPPDIHLKWLQVF
jgi:hypothetical protein